MQSRTHAIAGGIGFFLITIFWVSTVVAELFASHEAVALVKALILKGIFVLVPCLAIAGALGMAIGKNRTDKRALGKKRRMPIIALNGLLVLIPCAWFLAGKAAAGAFDATFYSIQVLELVVGATNLTMLALNIRDGLIMTGKIGAGNARPSPQQQPVIEALPAGPLVVKSAPQLVDSDGKKIVPKPVMTLCRCGQSRSKPLCDGAHNEIGFTSARAADRTADGLSLFEGKQSTVWYNRLLCSHAGECTTRLKKAFDTDRDPWIVPDNATTDQIKDVVRACPSGALSWSKPGGVAEQLVGGEPGITIERDGPYRVCQVALASGVDAEGACAQKYVLCRCGHSRNKPFCDGTHAVIGWRDQVT